jgi:hypothetical protein
MKQLRLLSASLTAVLSMVASTLVTATLLSACGGAPDDDFEGDGAGGKKKKTAGADGTDPASDPALCTSETYVGIGGTKLHESRVVAKLGVDRRRVKPFGALQGDYARVLGRAPASLNTAGPTFGEAEPTWYEEPQSSAVALQTAFGIAFDGCLTYTAKAEFDAAPSPATAPATCAAMAKSFWSKTPAPEEIQGCVDVATAAAGRERQARRAWAYACAAVLTSAEFLTY